MFAEIVFPCLYIGDHMVIRTMDPWVIRELGVRRIVVATEFPPSGDDIDRCQDSSLLVHWSPCSADDVLNPGYIDELVGTPTLYLSHTGRTAAMLAICWCLRTQSRTSDFARLYKFDQDGELLRFAVRLVRKRATDIDVRIVGAAKRTVETYEKWIRKNECDAGQQG
jgi:hypothetical protein